MGEKARAWMSGHRAELLELGIKLVLCPRRLQGEGPNEGRTREVAPGDCKASGSVCVSKALWQQTREYLDGLIDESRRVRAALGLGEKADIDETVKTLKVAVAKAGIVDRLHVLRPLVDWHEDYGPVLWWRLPIEEPPCAGDPRTDDWTEGYYTHWSVCPVPGQASSTWSWSWRRRDWRGLPDGWDAPPAKAGQDGET
jgi:hypothetical protein